MSPPQCLEDAEADEQAGPTTTFGDTTTPPPHPHNHYPHDLLEVEAATSVTTTSDSTSSKHHQCLSWIRGYFPFNLAILLSYVLISSANNSALVLLAKKGPPFETCNILCVANIIGLLAFIPFYGKDLRKWRTLSRGDWLALAVASISNNVIAALLYLEALQKIGVNAVAIMKQLEPVWFLGLAIRFLHEPLSPWVGGNASLIVVGVVLALVYPLMVGREVVLTIGYLWALLGGFSSVISTFIAKLYNKKIPIGIYVIFRVSLAAVIYHIIALIEKGPKGVGEIWSWELWSQLIWYGVIFVAIFQAAARNLYRYVSSGAIAAGQASLFVLNLLWAAVLVHHHHYHHYHYY